MPKFETSSSYRPTGDQPAAIEQLSRSILAGERYQTLLGATGTGKTATMAWIIEQVQKPTLVIAHNKTLAAQLCNEFREFFPNNAVEYFVSYYDYYQPEAYVPQADLYIEKDSSQNDDIARLRLAATSSLFTRRDVIVVASVSCIYGLGSPEEWRDRMIWLEVERGARPRPRPAQADRLAVRAQRHGARPRALPRQGRRRRDPAREPGDRVPHLVLRRRGRADHALRPAQRRGLREARQPRDLAGDGVRDVAADDRARRRRDPARARGAGQGARVGEQDARGAPAAAAHRVRPRDDEGARLLQRDRELLADPRGPRAGHASVHAARLLPERLRRLRRRVAPDGAADRRHVRGRPLAQADARRLRLPAAVGARQPAAALRRVPAEGAAARVRLGDARAVRAAPLDGRRRAADPADVPRRPRGRAARDAEPDRRPAERDPPPRGGRRARARHDADEEDVRGPDRLPARVGREGALPPLRDRHARADLRSSASCGSASTTCSSA